MSSRRSPGKRSTGSRSLRDEPDETSPSKMQRVVPQMDPGAGDEMDVDPYFGNPTSEIKADVKSQWRHFHNVNEFGHFVKWEPTTVKLLQLLFECSGLDFSSWIVERAKVFLVSVRNWIPESSGIHWARLPLSSAVGDKEKDDDLVSVYAELQKISPDVSLAKCTDYHHLLRRLLPLEANQSYPNELIWKAAERAFHRDQRHGRDVTTPIYKQILTHFNTYDSAVHLAPYTSIVGPSGIGKSFVVQQMARQHNIFVIYASLAKPSSRAYPRRSTIADLIPHHNRGDATTFFECFIAVSLVHVELCRQIGITPTSFFDLQTKHDFKEFQSSLAKDVEDVFSRAKSDRKDRRERSDDQSEFDYRAYIDQFLGECRRNSRHTFVKMHKELTKESKYAEYIDVKNSQSLSERNQPFALICIDEARELFSEDEGDPAMMFRALRRAMRHQTRFLNKGDPRQIFGLLLDTTSRVSNFSPPRDRDPSLKFLHPEGGALFAPIYQIDSMDIFTDGTGGEEGCQSQPTEAAHLFRLGRPLWGAIMEAGDLGSVRHLARMKMLGGETTERQKSSRDAESLAMLSYRINFYVVLHSLAEELVSGYLRFIVDINDDRTLLRTTQPSEPILAYTSARETMLHRKRRLNVIKALYDNTTKGSIHLGDIGEMVAALILMFTFDKVQQYRSEDVLPTPIRFADFLGSMLAKDKSFAIGNCMGEDEQMRRLWTNGYVFFNHFVRITERPTNETLRRAYQRGAAIFPPLGFKGCDIIVPVCLDDNMTYFIIQVKNRRDDSLTSGLRNEAKDSLKSASKLLPLSSAHMAMLMSLRSKSGHAYVDMAYPTERSQETRQTSTRTGQGKKGATSRSRNVGGSSAQSAPNYMWNDMKRVVVAAVGMSQELYPGLRFADEPEEEPETVEIVNYLKSLLNCTSELAVAIKDSYHEHLSPLG